jgi:hypothetical protein
MKPYYKNFQSNKDDAMIFGRATMLVFRKAKSTVDDAVAVRPRTHRNTRRHPSPLRCRSRTGASRTPASGRWKKVSLYLTVTDRSAREGTLPKSASDASPPAEEPRHPRPAPVTQRHCQSRRARISTRQTPPPFGNPSSRSLPSL